MSQFRTLPAASVTASNPSVGTNGAPAPTSATEVAGINPSGNLQPLQTDSSGNLLVSPSSFPSEQAVNLTEVGGSAIAIGQQLSAASLPVVLPAAQITALTPPTTVTVIQPTGSNLHVDVDSSVLPTGASTAALQSNVQSAPGSSASTALTIQGNASGIAIPISGTVTASNPSVGLTGSAVPTSATEIGGTDGTNLRAISVNASGQVNVNNISGTVSLPTGASTSALQSNVQSAVGSSATTAITIQGSSSGVAIPVSGTFTLPTGAATAANQLLPLGSVTGGTAATDSVLQGVQYNTGLPSLSSGQQAAMQSDAQGRVLISPSSFPTEQAVNLNQVGGSAIAIGSANSVTSNSLPVTMALDTNPIPTISSSSVVLSTPTSNSISSFGGTVQYTLNAGGNYYVTLTNGAGATTTWSGTVTFQYSLNGSSWNNIAVYPVAGPSGSASVSSTGVNGLWLLQAPSAVGAGTSGQVIYFRANMGSYTSGTVYLFVTPQSPPGSRVLLPWTYTVTSGNTLMGPIEASAFSEIDIQVSAITTTVYTAQGTNDPGLSTWVSLPVNTIDTQGSSVQTISAAHTYRIATTGFKWVRIQCTVSGSVGTIQGIIGVIGQQILLSEYGNDIGVTVNSGISSKGTASANAPVYNVYSSTNITTSAYVQLVASTSNVINNIHIFDSSGQAMILGVGGAGSEVVQVYVQPGGDTYTLNIPAGSRIAYKALTANATTGYLLMSFLE